MSAQVNKRHSKQSVVKRFFSNLGPGLITGADDDDPSGVATYSIAGAQLGTSIVWSAIRDQSDQGTLFGLRSSMAWSRLVT